MAYKIAVTSNGPLSGKTTLAEYFRDHYGFQVVSHSLTVVTAYVEDYNKRNAEPITVARVYQDKEAHRQALQSFGDRSGFNVQENALYWIEKTLGQWDGKSDLYYDPFRGEIQAQIMREKGFTLVQIEIPEDVRILRARKKGVDYLQILRSMEARPDLEKGIRQPDITLDGTWPTHRQAHLILSVPPRAHYEVSIFGQNVVVR